MSKLPLTFITYADSSFQVSANTLAKQAKKLGFEDIRVLGPTSLTEEFVRESSETLSMHRGAGYWLWKPWVIQNIAKCLPDGNGLMYVDAGVILKNDKDYFASLLLDDKIHLWRTEDDYNSNRYWIDESVWNTLVGPNLERTGFHFWAGAILSTNNHSFRSVVSDWLEYCKNPKLLRPDSFPNYEPNYDLIAHRHDQSILNCLVAREPELFRLHSLSMKEFGKVFLVHRRGNVKIVFLEKLYSNVKFQLIKLIRFFPICLQLLIWETITRIKKPGISKEELSRHRIFFLRR